MRYMMIVKANKDFEAGIPPSPGLIAAMGRLTDEMVKAGVLLACQGLQPSSNGTRIRHADAKRTVTDGPFVETKELIGGYAIVEAKSKQEAIEMANRMIDVHIDAGIAEFEMEIRPLFDPANFVPPTQ